MSEPYSPKSSIGAAISVEEIVSVIVFRLLIVFY